MLEKFKIELEKFLKILKNEFWSAELKDFSWFIRPLLFLCRFFYFILADFGKKKTLMMASSLSYATVLGIIPITMVILALSKGFLEASLIKYTPDIIDFLANKIVPVITDLPNKGAGLKLQQSIHDYINNQLIPRLTNLNFQEIGIYGALVLIVISFSLMRTIEKAFNDIWGVAFKRSVWNLILNYWLVIALFPAIMLIILWLTGFNFIHNFPQFKQYWLGQIVSRDIITFVILWILLTVLYKTIPNTHVKIMPAAVGGIVSGTLWQLNNMLSFLFVSNAIREHYLYGSLGLIPILLVGLFIGWLIILFGAHISYAIQNLEYFRIKLLSSDIEPSDLQEISLICMSIIALKFINKQQAPTSEDITKLSGLPFEYFSKALARMKDRDFVYKTDEDPCRYLLTVSPESIRLKDIMDGAIGHRNDKRLPLISKESIWYESLKICSNYRNCYTEETNPTLSDIVNNMRDKLKEEDK